MSKTRVEGNKVFIILEADSSSIHPDARCQQRVDLKKPSKRILVITSYPSQAISARIRSCRIKPQTKPSSNKAQQTQRQSFPSHSSPNACSFIPKDVFWRSSDQEARRSRPSIHLKIRQVESKKANSGPFPTHFMHANPSRSEKPARIQISNNCTRSSKETRNVCRQMKKKTA